MLVQGASGVEAESGTMNKSGRMGNETLPTHVLPEAADMANQQMAPGYGMGEGMALLTPQEVAAMLRLNYRYVRDKLAKRKDFL